ncbi:Signal transduction histidine kinase CheA [hydrothermal vent metagenome]|uniref:Chemotaxis protein CheA n=1 Tax=hydrothermal vent metagenome TaxID=652676 RepID=A0A3B0ZXH0_9ZZZZ
MSIDISQFLDTFYEESFEGLDIMESELLNLDVGEADEEVINTIFRAAHSIKGGSGTFGLNAVADYTHVMETLLDEMRAGQREVTQNAVDVLLRSVDVLRSMLLSLKDNEDLDHETIAKTHEELKVLLSGGNSPTESPATANAAAETIPQEKILGWTITFKPNADMLQTGNDPVRIIRELDSLGDISIEVNTEQLPELELIDPELSYLSWTIKMSGDVAEDDIKECFEWVEDECELSIIADKPEATAPASVPAAQERREGDRRQSDRRSSAKSSSKKPAESSSIRVNIDKVDDLINMVGELVITQSMLSQIGDSEEFDSAALERLNDGLTQLEQHTRELQESVMRIRMMPISFAFQRFPRLVHDLSSQLDKKIELVLTGESTELDKTVMEKIGDPLVHLVRNSLDHGIETPQVRLDNGKNETGTIELNAFHQGGNIVIEIKDDGAGLNHERILAKAIDSGVIKKEDKLTPEQINDLIFAPGFSTAEVVSDVSGRGVGMDVVRRNIRALGGTVEVQSEAGVGSVFTIRLPLTLAILDGQLVRVGKETYIVPLISIIESLQINSEMINSVTGAADVYKLRDDYIPIVRLYDIFGIDADTTDITDGLLVVVENEGKKIAICVDELLGQQQVVIKSLETNLKQIDGLSGATILGNGTVALILDINGVMHLYQHSRKLSAVTSHQKIIAA